MDREIDVEIILKKHVAKGMDGDEKTYILYGVGKNRRASETPTTHKFGGLPFVEGSGLLPDLNTDSTFVELKKLKSPGADAAEW